MIGDDLILYPCSNRFSGLNVGCNCGLLDESAASYAVLVIVQVNALVNTVIGA